MYLLCPQVRIFKITPSLIADSLPVARMCARCPAVDLNVTDSENQTALIHAAGKNNFEVVKTLLQQSVLESSKIDIDHKDVSTQLQLALCIVSASTILIALTMFFTEQRAYSYPCSRRKWEHRNSGVPAENISYFKNRC